MRRRGPIALGLVALVVGVFAQVRHHEFVDYDDFIFVAGLVDESRPGLAKPDVRDGLTASNVVDAFSSYYFWTPLSTLSIELDHELFGPEPAGFLLTNVALHAVSTLLLFAALARATGRLGRSAFVAAVFAVHPLNVEPVAWASGRKDVLACTAFMLAILAHVRYAERPSIARYCGVAGAFALGLLAKPTLVVLPFVLLLLDGWPLGRLGPRPAVFVAARVRRAVLEKLPLLALAAGASALTLTSYAGAGNLYTGPDAPLDVRLASAVHAYAFYVAKCFWPSDLTAFYPHVGGALAPVEAPGPAWQTLLYAASLLCVTAFSLWRAARAPWLAVGWLWFVGCFAPVIGIVQVFTGARADRYAYLPIVGMAIAVAWGAVAVAGRTPRGRRALSAAGALAVAALAVAAWNQVGTWRDTLTLFERATRVTEDNWFAHHGIAKKLLSDGRLDEAEAHYREVFRLRPEWSRPYFELASAVGNAGDVEHAIELWERGLEIDPNHARARGFLGLALLRVGRFAEAGPNLGFALQRHDSAILHAGLAKAYTGIGRPDAAVPHYRSALEIEPDPGTAAALAWILATHPADSVRDPEEAVRVAGEALARVGGGDVPLLRALAAAHAAAGDFAAAVDAADRGIARAKSEGALAAAAELRLHLARYRKGMPWVEVPAARSADAAPEP